MLAGGIETYRHEDYEQLKLEMPFGVTMREDNRWVILSKLFPWEAIEREYARNFTENEGQAALPFRTMASPFDASMMTYFRKRIFAEMIENIQAQILVAEAVARQEEVAEITGEEAGKIAEEESSMAVEPTLENHGTLILEATCCPADI